MYNKLCLMYSLNVILDSFQFYQRPCGFGVDAISQASYNRTSSQHLKSVNGDSKQCRDLSPHDMNKLYTKFHVFLPSHFEAIEHFVLGSLLGTGFSYLI